MKEEMRRLKGAVESLKLVAKSFHVPFDTSEFESAWRAVQRKAPKDSEPEHIQPKDDTEAKAGFQKADEKK